MFRKLSIAAMLALGVLGGTAMAADPRHRVVQGFGAITPMPDAKERRDQSLRYRVLFSVTKAAATPDQVNPCLEKVARFINLLGADGVHPKLGDVVVIMHGPATPLVLTDARYAERNKGASDPNLALIAALRSAGVSVRVCSQVSTADQFQARGSRIPSFR